MYLCLGHVVTFALCFSVKWVFHNRSKQFVQIIFHSRKSTNTKNCIFCLLFPQLFRIYTCQQIPKEFKSKLCVLKKVSGPKPTYSLKPYGRPFHFHTLLNTWALTAASTWVKLAQLPCCTLIQCTPLFLEKAGVAPDVTFGITICKQERVQARDPPVRKDTQSQNRSNQSLHKLGLGPTKN